MPCYTRRTVTADMKVADLDALAAAVAAAGGRYITRTQDGALVWSQNGLPASWREGVLSLRTTGTDNTVINVVKRAYTAELFRRAAKKAGFTVKAGNTTLVAERRVYTTS